MAIARKNYQVDSTSLLHTKIGKKPSSRNTSGYVGVTWDSAREKWAAQIEFKGKHYHLGRYDTITEAADVRRIAEESLFGGFHKEFAEKYPEVWEKVKDRLYGEQS